MKSLNPLIIAISTAFSVIMYSCETQHVESKETVLELPTTPYDYQVDTRDEVPTLGRVLFYDVRLSANNSISCSSCHKQALAFTDNSRFSLGFQNKLTTRNSMPIQNIVSTTFNKSSSDSLASGGLVIDTTPTQSTALFWDGRQHDLQTMVMEPIQNHIEMGVNNLDELAAKVASIQEYQQLFSAAFVDGEVSKEHIANALSAFLASIRSNQSRFDESLTGQTQLTGLEQSGKNLFFDRYDCNSCHQLQQPFNGYQLAGGGGMVDIGLDQEPSDPGAFRTTGVQTDNGKFKIPSLRNVALTAPYMHDGRFKTLEEVLDHYSEGIENSENLDSRLRNANGSPKQFDIPSTDKRAIIAFLHSLTDPHMIGDPKFSNPFKIK